MFAGAILGWNREHIVPYSEMCCEGFFNAQTRAEEIGLGVLPGL